MKIGIDARMINATGIGRYTKNLIENLSLLDRQNKYFIFMKSESIGTMKLAENFSEIPADFHWYGLTEQIRFPKLISKYKIDLMHFPHFNVPFFYRGKFVVTIHDLTLHSHKTIKASTKNAMVYELKHFLYKKIIKNAVEKSEIIFSPSEFTKQEIVKNLNIQKDKIVVTTESASSEELLAAAPNSGIAKRAGIEEPYILYVGNAYPHKNLDVLLRVIEKLPQNIRFVLAGKEDDFYGFLKEKVAKLKLNERIIFTGYVSDSELAWLYRHAKIYIFPSLNEGFGLPLLEAASFGLPVICSGTSSLPEVMGDAALYFNPSSALDVSKKLNKLLGDKKLQESLKQKGLSRVKDFSWKGMAEKTLNMYNKLSS